MEVPTIQDHEELRATVQVLLKRVTVLEAQQPVSKIEVAEASEMLHVCEATVRAMAKRGDLEMVRFGHKIYVTLSSVRDWENKHLIT